nr:hypothetical protein Iba_chr12cCG5200 [Ipomoea batatas]
MLTVMRYARLTVMACTCYIFRTEGHFRATNSFHKYRTFTPNDPKGRIGCTLDTASLEYASSGLLSPRAAAVPQSFRQWLHMKQRLLDPHPLSLSLREVSLSTRRRIGAVKSQPYIHNSSQRNGGKSQARPKTVQWVLAEIVNQGNWFSDEIILSFTVKEARGWGSLEEILDEVTDSAFDAVFRNLGLNIHMPAIRAMGYESSIASSFNLNRSIKSILILYLFSASDAELQNRIGEGMEDFRMMNPTQIDLVPE